MKNVHVSCMWVAAMLAAAAMSGEAKKMANPGARTLDTHHLFTPPASKEAWEERAHSLRTQILFSAGLYPMPEKTALNARVTGTIEGPDYIIENVALETFPRFYLCGNLYRPKGKTGKLPAIANPHGHWANGRLHIEPDVPPPAPNAEKPAPGKGNLVAIGVNLARQGYVVFAYDMTGYNDTMQLGDHRKFAADVRPWLWNVNLCGLQLWNSIRVVDYLESRPDVDKKRIGVTGASGGGTQSFLLCAVDERIKAAVPVNMISAHMQGGCLCENGPGLRVNTDNVEIGALMAPKPLLLIAATGDWTKNNPTMEWPAIQKIYQLYGKADRTAVRQFNYGHNYNVESREAMYAWFAKWLLDDEHAEKYREKPFEADVKAMRVWNGEAKLPDNALKDGEFIQARIDESEKLLAGLWPKDKGTLKEFRKTMAPALAHSLAVNADEERALPGSSAREAKTRSNERALVIVIRKGEEASAAKLSERAGAAGWLPVTLALDARKDVQLWPEFFTCYNRTPLGGEVQTILDELERLRRQPGIKRVDLAGLGSTGIAALLARGLFNGNGSAVVDMGGFDSGDDQAYIKSCYAPGLRRAGDVRTAAALAAPAPLCLFNTATAFKTEATSSAYRALGAELRVEAGAITGDDIVKWLAASEGK